MRFFEVETELTDEEMAKEDKGLDEDTAVFSKSIPARVLLTPDRLDAILNSDKANLLLTKIQGEVLLANRPLLIHGQAGSGKTTVLCNRLALSIWHRNQQISRIAFLTYNEKLVKQAERDTDEILDLQYGYKGGLSGVSFRPLNAFLKQYVHDPSRFSTDKYVLYGRFKGYYEMYRRGNPVAKRVACEVAWHGIRSILKGACVPPLIPPLSHEKYDSLARKRRDFPDEIFEDIYAIGEWYQKEIIQKNGLWDDQDLAWAALKWIMDMQASKEKMLKYDEIFCDEGQDLTEIEFKILVSLCKQPLAAAEEGLPLVFAGDPLQTINPTGFKWSIIKNEVYNVQGKPVGLHYLKENFRSDKRIVKFANYIQKTRSYYLGQPVDEQLGFEKDGDIPQIIIADTQDEVALLQERLGELNQIPDVAVIVWPEGTDAIERFCKQEDALLKLDRTINPYSISEAKGLEFRLVVLYKFGSSDDMIRWKGYLAENKPIDAENEIPLLYFLNRLYVAVTRAKLFLVIVDTLSGVDNFLSIWKKAEQDKDVYLWSRADIRSFFDSHPAFGGDSSEEAWRQWAEKLFDYAERTRDLRLYERARRAFEKANETQNMKRVDARLAEIAEKWNDAGKLYFELNEFEPSRSCYSRAENWDGALKSTERLPTTPQTKRYLAIYKFETSRKQNANNSAVEFYEYAMTDNGIERRYLEELGAALIQSGDNSRAAQVLLGIAQRFADKAILIKAADSFFGARNFEYAEKLYLEAGETKAHSYYISRAENLLQKGEYIESARIFFENGSPEKVVKIFEQSEREKGSSPKGQLLEIAADSFFKLGRFDRALPAYKSLLTDLGRSQDGKILGQIGQCLEILGDKFGAYERYRDARLYKKAADLGVEIGVPDEQIIRLRTREAMDNNDFEKAAKLAYNSEDEKLVHITAGQYYAHKRDFVKAIPEFTKAEMWKEALDSIIQAQTQAGGHYIEELDQSCNFLLSIAKSKIR
jgi:tetratricopeptide (TPR) repeat protein